MEVIGLGMIIYLGVIAWRFVVIPLYTKFVLGEETHPNDNNNNSTY